MADKQVSEPLRLAMWSGPRNLSTAMMRAWENRADTAVIDEPLYAHYLTKTGLSDHPMTPDILASQPVTEDEAVAACFAPVADGITIDYQKHMAQHLLPGMDRAWLDRQTIVVLLRDPRRVLASYSKVRAQPTLADIGLPQQLELAERAVVVIDSGRFLSKPKAYLEAICERVGLPFDESMLSWPAGTRDSDGVWAPAWYSSVEASTCFGPAPADHEPAELDDSLESVAAEAAEIYQSLLGNSLDLG